MGAKLTNCKQCGKLFMSQRGEKICQACVDEMANLELVVVDYVRDHPKCKIPEIMQETGAPEILIRRLIDEGRFVQSGVNFSYPCKKCGKEIFSGQYCEDCLNEMQESLQNATAKVAANAEAAAADRGHGMYSKDMQKTAAKVK